MRPRVRFFGLRVCLAALAVFLVPPAIAQQSTTISISTPSTATPTVATPSVATPEVADLLREGRALEVEHRWSEALSHYEGAMRKFPDDASLQRRYRFARLHYDVRRRCMDHSFRRSVAELPLGKALDLYGEVLLKIQVRYIDAPHWKQVVEHGTNNLEVALTESAFLERNLPERNRSAVDGFRRELRRLVGLRVVNSRDDARDAVASAADLAQRRLRLPPSAVVLEYVCGAVSGLDPYSAYLTPDQWSEVHSQIEGNFVGLGIELEVQRGSLLIARVIPGSPAEQSGIRAGDRIVSVDGQATEKLSTDEAANLLQGDEGSVVQLAVATPGKPPRQLSVRRQRVEVPSVEDVKILDTDYGIGYLRLACFQKTTCRDLDAALWKLHRQGMRRLVIDLRGNPGGLLTAAVDAADKFVERGIIVSTRGRNIREDHTYSARAAGTWPTPLVVLIDEESASAAEIFAGAIGEHRRGTIVGMRSYGKGTVQGIFPLDMSLARVRLTTAKFYSPSGRPYTRIGVEPDLVVRLAAKPIDGQATDRTAYGDDAMLAAAVQAARRLGRVRSARR